MSRKRILLVAGHTPGHNYSRLTGANEGDLNIELVRLLKKRLMGYAEVTVYPEKRDLYRDHLAGVSRVRFRDYDYVFEVHFNAGGGQGRGTSVQLHKDYKKGITVEQGIADRLGAVGFRKRGTNGIVRRGDLYNMNLAFRQGVDYALLETCFYDNKEDLSLYRSHKAAVADAIADGICQGFGLSRNGMAESKASGGQTGKTPEESGISSYASWVGQVYQTDPLGLIVRTGPGKSYDRLSAYPKLYDGNLVSVIGREKDYYRIRISNQEAGTHYGWASTAYIRKAP